MTYRLRLPNDNIPLAGLDFPSVLDAMEYCVWEFSFCAVFEVVDLDNNKAALAVVGKGGLA